MSGSASLSSSSSVSRVPWRIIRSFSTLFPFPSLEQHGVATSGSAGLVCFPSLHHAQYCKDQPRGKMPAIRLLLDTSNTYTTRVPILSQTNAPVEDSRPASEHGSFGRRSCGSFRPGCPLELESRLELPCRDAQATGPEQNVTCSLEQCIKNGAHSKILPIIGR